MENPDKQNELVEASASEPVVDDQYHILAAEDVPETAQENTRTKRPTLQSPDLKGFNVKNFFYGLLSGEGKFRHVFFIVIALAVIASIHPTYVAYSKFLPVTDGLEDKVIALVDEVFPEELEITIQNGVAETNVPEPYYLSVNKSDLESFSFLFEEEDISLSKIRLLTIDTNGKVEDFERHQSMAMLTRENFVYYNEGSIQISSLRSVPDTKIDKQLIVDQVKQQNENNRIVKFVRLFIYFVPALTMFGYIFFYLASFAIGTFFVFVMNKILETQIKLKHMFRFYSALFMVPALFLLIVKYIPYVKHFGVWINTATNVLVLSVAYVFLKGFKERNYEST